MVCSYICGSLGRNNEAEQLSGSRERQKWGEGGGEREEERDDVIDVIMWD